MQILELEEKYSELKSDLCGQYSKRTKLLKISAYFGFALSFPNSQIIESYITDLIADFLKYIYDLEIRGLNPDILEKLKTQLIQIKNLNLTEINSDEINNVLYALDQKIILLKYWLGGKQTVKDNSKMYFPLLEKNGDELGAGYLESVSVLIKNGEQKYHISPADLENDDQLEKQVQLCFNKAVDYCRQYVTKIRLTHTVYLHFEKRLGILTGNSLGAALTVSFIEAILKHYNSPVVVNINKSIAITGGINEDSKFISTSKTIIQSKVETVFYSEADIFCLPKVDEIWAEEKLNELLKKHPERNLKIIGLDDLNDLLDRRQIVDIRKQKLVVRSGKFIKNNWISAIATVLLAILFAFLFVMDFDDNPASLEHDSHTLYVKNKKGRILWTLTSNPNIDILAYPELIKNFAKILDINNDTENELLFIQTAWDENNKNQDRGTIICFDSYQKIKWKYTFRDTVYSERENLEPLYGIYLIDTTTIENKKTILCYANNSTSFSSAIFALDLNTGERVNNTQWNSGYTWDAVIVDIDENGERESIVAIGADNGFNDGVIYGVKLKNLNGFRPTTPEYKINNLSQTELIFYIRIPKTDYDILRGDRVVGLQAGSLDYNGIKKEFHFTTLSAMDETDRARFPSRYYKLNINTMQFDIYMIDKFSSLRDSLVTKSKLKPPYTDTKEFKELIMNDILYWKDGKWVNRYGVEKK